MDYIVKEGLWLYSHDIDPYAGGVFRHVRMEFTSGSKRLIGSFDPVPVVSFHLFYPVATTTYRMGIERYSGCLGTTPHLARPAACW